MRILPRQLLYRWPTFLCMAVALTLMLIPSPAVAQLANCTTPASNPGGVINNGAATQPCFVAPADQAAAGLPGQFLTSPGLNFALAPGFLFEPETPFASLKEVPTWNEIEQLLDNPYVVAYDPTTPPNFQGFPSYRSIVCATPTSTGCLQRRPSFDTPGSTLYGNQGNPLPGLLTHALNYNPGTGKEMRLLNPGFPATSWIVPNQVFRPSPTLLPNLWMWNYSQVTVSPGSTRVNDTEIDYNGPEAPQVLNCVNQVELVPPEGTTFCGADPGEPRYAGFGIFRGNSYSTPAYRFPNAPASICLPLVGCTVPAGAPNESTIINTTVHQLFDPAGRGVIQPRTANGRNGLHKPSLRLAEVGGTSANPNYLINSLSSIGDASITPLAASAANLKPSNENDYVRNRVAAMQLGKALFWDMQVGSDSVQSCGTCHAHAAADNRTKNALNPNHTGPQGFGARLDLHGIGTTVNTDVTAADFPLHKLTDPDVAGDPACGTPIIATINAGILENTPETKGVSGTAATGVTMTVCDANNATHDSDDVVSSMGVHYGRFLDIAPIGTFGPASSVGGVKSAAADLRQPSTVPDSSDPIADFGGAVDPVTGLANQFRRVEPRNTPTIFMASLNFDNFWDGRARHDFNGGSVFGAADPQSHVFVDQNSGLQATRQLIKFASLASLATGPGLSEFEMSFQGRNWSKVGKKLLQAGVTPLANQLVAVDDSVLGQWSNQGGSGCASLPGADRSVSWAGRQTGKPGLCISYPALIRRAFYPALWQNASSHLNGCYNDAVHHPAGPLCGGTSFNDPFDGYVLSIAPGAASPADTNQLTQMEGNFSLFWGLSVDLWATILMPDNTPLDQFLAVNPDAFMALGDATERKLVDDLLNCTTPGQRNVLGVNGQPLADPSRPGSAIGACFTEVGRFKRDPNVIAETSCTTEGGVGCVQHPAGGTRQPNDPDPLLGMDIFMASNLSLKNPNFRTGRCGACHNMPTLTDNTMPFTFKAQLPDTPQEFSPAAPGVGTLVEPLGRLRTISGFLLESEISETGQDSMERRFVNQSIVPNPATGYAYPDGLSDASGNFAGAGQAFLDNGIYNLGVRPSDEDIGRGGNDAFGWPLSLAALFMKNLAGNNGDVCASSAACFEPGVAMSTFDPGLGVEGGLFEESAQDQKINPGGTNEAANPLLPPYLAPFAPGMVVGDGQPALDEPFGGINTLTDVAMLEGFADVLGPNNIADTISENMNNSLEQLMGTWPVVNRVNRNGMFKAAQLREVELTGPYFHNGGKLTLRQVVDFYDRGGDFPVTNAADRDFNIVNQNVEVQSNLTEAEKVALVDFLLELTDERVRYERAPFDHPEIILPLDGTAPENGQVVGTTTVNRDAMLRDCADASQFGPGQRACATTLSTTGAPAFLDVPATGTNGTAAPLPNFLGIASTPRLVGADAYCTTINNQYCH